MSAAREAILGRVRSALGKSGRDVKAIAEAQATIDKHTHGPRPRAITDPIARFLRRATDMESTVERINAREEIHSLLAGSQFRIIDETSLSRFYIVSAVKAGVPPEAM